MGKEEWESQVKYIFIISVMYDCEKYGLLRWTSKMGF